MKIKGGIAFSNYTGGLGDYPPLVQEMVSRATAFLPEFMILLSSFIIESASCI